MRERLEGQRGRRGTFLAMIGPDDAAAFQSLLTEREAAAGRVLLHAGAPGESLLLLLKGRVKIVAPAAPGQEVMLGFAGPGELVGELGALDGWPRTADVIALDRVRAGYLAAPELRAFLAERPAAGLALMRMMAGRIRHLDHDRVQMASSDGFSRIAALLLDLAERFGEPVQGGVRIELQATQHELASWIGASRITVARALCLMRRLGWVSTERRAITVLDATAMRAQLDGAQVNVVSASLVAA